MKEASINARIPSSLKAQVIAECKKKGISLTAYMIRALTHELHGRKSDAIIVQELNDLKLLIDVRIKEYDCNTDVLQNEVKDLDYYMKYIKNKQETHGQVSESLINKIAKKVGITFDELLQELTEEGINVNIM